MCEVWGCWPPHPGGPGGDGNRPRHGGRWPRKSKQSHRAPDCRPMSVAAEPLPGSRPASRSRGACDTSQAGRGHGAGRSRPGQEQRASRLAGSRAGMGNVSRAPTPARSHAGGAGLWAGVLAVAGHGWLGSLSSDAHPAQWGHPRAYCFPEGPVGGQGLGCRWDTPTQARRDRGRRPGNESVLPASGGGHAPLPCPQLPSVFSPAEEPGPAPQTHTGALALCPAAAADFPPGGPARGLLSVSQPS